ncbi:MAG: universal stress protein, partial [Candidatus Limnocylindrales bacterium]
MRVLFGYDGSAPADQACDLIAGIDWPPETGLRVVTAYQLLVPGSGWPGEIVDGATAEAIFEADRVFAEGRARAVAERIRRPGLTVTWTALIGRPASAVLDEAAARPIDLLVVGSRGLGPFTAALLGSVSAELVDHAPCPVLVARGRTVERVILAEDGSPGAEAAAVVLAWPIFARSRVRVVTVYEAEGRGGLAPTATSEAAASARSRLVERGLA